MLVIAGRQVERISNKKLKRKAMTGKTIEITMKITPKLRKNWHAALHRYKRIKSIKRTRKRQVKKAKHMMVWHDHTSFEWSQWWKKKARKPKKWKK